MFTQAGFNPRHRVLARGMIYRAEWKRGARPSALVMFECGDLAWLGRGPIGAGVSWGEQVLVRSLFWPIFEGIRGRLEACELPRAFHVEQVQKKHGEQGDEATGGST